MGSATKVLIILIITFMSLDAFQISRFNNVCTTPTCKMAASRIKAMMDLNANPCHDFSQFVCGNLYKKAGNKKVSGAFDKAEKRNLILFKKLLSLPQDSNSSNSYLIKMKRFYKECQDLDAIERRGLVDYKEEYKQEWPTLNTNWDPSSFDLQTVVNKATERFSFVLFYLDPLVDQTTDKDIYVPDIGPPLSFLEEEDDDAVRGGPRSLRDEEEGYGEEEDGEEEEGEDNGEEEGEDAEGEEEGGKDTSSLSEWEAIGTYYTKVALALGADEETAKNDRLGIITALMALAEHSDSDEAAAKRVSKSNRMKRAAQNSESSYTLGMMNQKYPYLDWVQVIQSLFPDGTKKISESQIVQFYEPMYFEALGTIIKQTEKRTLQNMFGFQHALSLIGDSTQYMLELKEDVKLAQNTEYTKKKARAKRNGEDQSETAEFCAKEVDKIYNFGMGKLVSKTRFSNDAHKFMDKLLDNLKGAYKTSLQTIPWMQEETRQEALKKLKNMGRQIGIQSQEFSDKDINDLYKNYKVTGNYNADRNQNKRQASLQSWSRINKERVKWRWTGTMTAVNAFFEQDSNGVVFPLGILQRPFFEQNVPSYLNYGGIGSVIGHEIGHGFDTEGRGNDERGRARDWWTQADTDKYNERAQCFINQYNHFNVTVGGKTYSIDGDLTKAENIADSLGVHQAYRAYQTYAAQEGKTELTLPDLGLTKDQLFFVSYAHGYCMNENPKEIIELLEEDPHAPDISRIIGPLQNMKEFSQVYNCKAGDYMNPVKKCVLW